MAKEWVNDAQNEARVEANHRAEANRALGVSKQKKKGLASKLIKEERACLSAEAGLKNAENQAEDQREKLHIIEIELAIQRQLVLELKADLQRAKEVAWVAKEASEVAEMVAYEHGAQETETRLAEEVVEVCRNYYTQVWAEVLNQVGVLADSELRRAENTYFWEDIREVPTMIPPPVADSLHSLEQLSTNQSPFPNIEVSIGVGKGEEAQPPIKANHSKDALTIKNVVFKAKDAESKSKAGDTQFRAVDPKEDPHQAKAQLQDFIYLLLFFLYFLLWYFTTVCNILSF